MLVRVLAGAALGLAIGAVVALVARTLPERGRLLGRPICGEHGCGLDWTALSQTLRVCGLRRACPTCGARPARGDVLLELGTAVLFAALVGREPLGATLAVDLLFAALLLVILTIDLRHRDVYLVLGLGGVVLGLALAPLSMSGGLLSATLGGSIGGLAFGGLYALGRALYRGGEPLGTGDITIAALLGVMAGFPGIVTALLVGIAVGGVWAAVVLARQGTGQTFMPYGPALCLGGFWVMLVR
ncbi:MAG: prepilin peptidase [Chloroflexi bacterium]|nr:prepilin peptidase [Chloroflexota bacterium]